MERTPLPGIVASWFFLLQFTFSTSFAYVNLFQRKVLWPNYSWRRPQWKQYAPCYCTFWAGTMYSLLDLVCASCTENPYWVSTVDCRLNFSCTNNLLYLVPSPVRKVQNESSRQTFLQSLKWKFSNKATDPLSFPTRRDFLATPLMDVIPWRKTNQTKEKYTVSLLEV